MSTILAIAGADVAERTRRFAFIVTIAAALYAGYLYTPSAHASYMTMDMQGYRGLYNSAYLGALISLLGGPFLTFAGFFLVRGALERDRELGVDGLVAASPVRRMTYVFGKYASNLVVLLAIAALSMLAGAFMQQLRGEDRHFDLLAYVLPLLTITLPTVAVVAAIAILFDSVRWLRGAIGSIVFLFVWMQMLAFPAMTSANMTHAVFLDPLGTSQIASSLQHALHAEFPAVPVRDIEVGFSPAPKGGLKTYVFTGFTWSAQLLAQRLFWLLASFVIVALSSLFFDRFCREEMQTKRSGRQFDAARLIPNLPVLRLFRAEFALLLNGASVWWWAGASAITIAGAVTPLQSAVRFVLPLAFIWPLERLSALGARERRWNVLDVLASTDRYAQRTIGAQTLAGTILLTLLCIGFILHLLVTGAFASVLACILVAAAIAACALACGTLSGGSRLFEAMFLVLWYIGPVNAAPVLDFSGATLFAPLTLAEVAAALCALAVTSAGVMRRRI